MSSGKTTCHANTSVESSSLQSVTAEYSSVEAPYLRVNSVENPSIGSFPNKNNHVTDDRADTSSVESHAAEFAETLKEKDRRTSVMAV